MPHSTQTSALVQITTDPLDVTAHLNAIDDGRCGAVVTFIGQVRDHDPHVQGRVTGIEYVAHPDASDALRVIVTRHLEEYPDASLQVAVSHRVGHLTVGEVAVVLCVAAPHRDQAYRSSRAIIERIKTELPVWKKQHGADGGSRWSGL